MTCSRCHRADCRVSELVQLLTTDNAPGVPMLDRVAAMLECVTRQAGALEAEVVALREENKRQAYALARLTLRQFEQSGPVYSLLEGHSVSERGTLTNGEGGILQARNVWTLVDLQRAEALAVGEQCKLDGDEVWIRREE